jgi:hypothetical protein
VRGAGLRTSETECVCASTGQKLSQVTVYDIKSYYDKCAVYTELPGSSHAATKEPKRW